MYESNCYYCHGYRGDAATKAAEVLDPPPLNFQRAENLTVERVERAVRFGRKGAAMQSFAARLSDEEIHAVAIYVTSGLAKSAAYHTAENGWPDHAARNGAAFPFVRGEIALDAPASSLNEEQRKGLALFKSACAVCHRGKYEKSNTNVFRRVDQTASPSAMAITFSPPPAAVSVKPRTLSGKRRTGDCSRCHDDLDESGNPMTPQASADAYGPGPHDVAPKVDGLTPVEQRGRDLYQAACADCHAADGTGANWVGNFLEDSPTDFSAPE
ncbi:MAG TPA: c-type cytochrome, partial [Parvularculaceae bacterium]|nr:c-type cytochrome [Parvularculaceae bacterium]